MLLNTGLHWKGPRRRRNMPQRMSRTESGGAVRQFVVSKVKRKPELPRSGSSPVHETSVAAVRKSLANLLNINYDFDKDDDDLSRPSLSYAVLVSVARNRAFQAFQTARLSAGVMFIAAFEY